MPHLARCSAGKRRSGEWLCRDPKFRSWLDGSETRFSAISSGETRCWLHDNPGVPFGFEPFSIKGRLAPRPGTGLFHVEHSRELDSQIQGITGRLEGCILLHCSTWNITGTIIDPFPLSYPQPQPAGTLFRISLFQSLFRELHRFSSENFPVPRLRHCPPAPRRSKLLTCG